MSEITVKFAFEIGEVVYFKTAEHDATHTPKQFIITERIAQQQVSRDTLLFYALSNTMENVPEIMLTRECPVYQPRCEAYYEEQFQNSWGGGRWEARREQRAKGKE